MVKAAPPPLPVYEPEAEPEDDVPGDGSASKSGMGYHKQGGRRADGGAFADLGKPGGGSGGRGSSPGFCMDPGGCLVGVRWDCGGVSGRFLIEH